ncbi:MAG: hydrogenase iron-sulfur subunit [Desulfosarcina sp.]|nr:hydrogenase iron-sulfur subunit [Desulfosarcina sp.]MBC2743545.1 hydrogenase iron-sulfur subunit [Desulfosarcina sp.]MBC2766454.1 hydrogenase iron-sulfur subunit [Desulfosarcina sp.]
MRNGSKVKVTVFHCINVFSEGDSRLAAKGENVELKFVRLPCSSLVKDVFLLRAFEAGADAVVVLVCPEGACRYVEGNLRAKKRVQWVRSLLDEIGMDGNRLALFNLPPGDSSDAKPIIQKVLAQIGTTPQAELSDRPPAGQA